MKWFKRTESNPTQGPPQEHRRAPRHTTGTQITCPLGQLEDLSVGGMKVVSKEKPPVKIGQHLRLGIATGGQQVKVTGTIVRIRRKSFRSYEVGVRFSNLKPRTAKAIESLAVLGFVDSQTLGGDTIGSGPGHDQQSQGHQQKADAWVEAHLMDLYGILHVSPDASFEQIHQAYRVLARKYHPDVCNDPDAVERFQQIHDAYTVLKDTQKRATYDKHTGGID